MKTRLLTVFFIILTVIFISSIIFCLIVQDMPQDSFPSDEFLKGFWFFVVFDILLYIFILYDFILIRWKKKKYGEMKYILKRKQNYSERSINVGIWIVFISGVMGFIFTYENTTFVSISNVYGFSMLILSKGFKFFDIEGMNDECINYIGAVPLKWSKVTSCKIKSDILEFTTVSKFLRSTYESKLLFEYDASELEEIEEFLSGKFSEK